MKQGPLQGIRIVDAGLLVQGPQAAALLCDMGADVIKVELPLFGDQARYIFVDDDDHRSAYYIACNRGKRSITIDLRYTEGADIFKRLISDVDVVISNFSHGTMESWGIGFDVLADINSRLIWASGNTFGPLGPDRFREGADLAGQCAGGLISTVGNDGEPPSPVGVTIADHIGSLNMACGVLAALHARAKTGKGQKVEVSLIGGQIWAQAAEYTHYLLTQKLPGRANRGHPLIRSPYGIFETKDGWLGLVGIPPKSLDAFLIAVNRPELLIDVRASELRTSKDALSWFKSMVAEIFCEYTSAELGTILESAGIRYAPIWDYSDVERDPGIWENGYLTEMEDSEGETHRVVGSPIRLSDTPLVPGATPPSLGEHNAEVFSALGLTTKEINTLQLQNII